MPDEIPVGPIMRAYTIEEDRAVTPRVVVGDNALLRTDIHQPAITVGHISNRPGRVFVELYPDSQAQWNRIGDPDVTLNWVSFENRDAPVEETTDSPKWDLRYLVLEEDPPDEDTAIADMAFVRVLLPVRVNERTLRIGRAYVFANGRRRTQDGGGRQIIMLLPKDAKVTFRLRGSGDPNEPVEEVTYAWNPEEGLREVEPDQED